MQIKPDLILAWPRNCDYPPYRQFLKENRDRLGDIFIVFTETYGGEDYRDFVKTTLSELNIYFLLGKEPDLAGLRDWRNDAVNTALGLSRNEWVWFSEQDFEIKEGFWTKVYELAEMNDVFGVYEAERLHPCCIFCKRELINRTHRDFAAGNGHDHFGRFQSDLMGLGIVPPKIKEDLYYHMAGLSHNIALASRGDPVTYKPEEFKDWLRRSIKIEPCDKRFLKLAVCMGVC